jgi:hypothetical protein
MIKNKKQKPARKGFFQHRAFSRPKDELKKIMKLPKWHNLKGLLFKNSLLLRRDIG